MTDRRRNGLILLLVLGLIAASMAAIFTKKTRLGLDLKGGVELVYQGQPTAQQPKVTQDALSRAVDIMRERVDQLGVAEPEIQRSGADQIAVSLPSVKNVKRAEAIVGSPAQLTFYDWEQNVIGPDGKPIIDKLQSQDADAVRLSQGAGIADAGLPLYDAVKLASKRPYQASADNSQVLPRYYLFAAPGSALCKAKKTPVGLHCLVAGPDSTYRDLISELTPARQPAGTELLTVKRGTVVLQAAPRTSKDKVAFESPLAKFYVLADHVSLFGKDLTDPKQGFDQLGAPDVEFNFTGKGKKEFHAVTRAIAHRGATLSPIGSRCNQANSLCQHFAVALDRGLISVPYIDPNDNPDGIDGETGATIQGGFSISGAQDLATQLRLGALPIGLKLISQSQVSATLGKEALHQGLLAGIAGLIVVVLFLLTLYRVLGVIAAAALAVYAIYFFALIKLVPITLTLPGIAGLILTIGVAADANIVIFERVKEEVRHGRSIPQAIVQGYKKGLTAIIDANVVTVMTAFILFILATSEVKGFAFTLGIGTLVSLFTAVLATQAILATMGRSRVLRRPSALGVSKRRREWRFDFMGASRWFFSVSGVILLVGALAIGGKGLNFGIDFTSGTRITTDVAQAATEQQVRDVLTQFGAGDAKIQKVTDAKLGKHVFQISTKKLQPNRVSAVKARLQARFGGTRNFSNSSVGPTFGKTVANSAVIAIIASLLVISAYIALRFEWKFAVPVLIALMHDLLITSGVYSLTGREVTTATVAALLTILGYSLYDTIIVFDRVRENVPRMPRAAFSQIVNRSMAEVLTRSLATTFSTLLPIIALLFFGGETLKDFAFALLIGVASGAYSSIFIASPVLTHWKEREPVYAARRERIEAENDGHVPAYAAASDAVDVEPRARRRALAGRLTSPDDPTQVSAADFEAMKRDLDIDDDAAIARPQRASRSTSTVTPPRPAPAPPPAPAESPAHAPDEPENDGIAAQPAKPQRPKSGAKRRNRRHGRTR